MLGNTKGKMINQYVPDYVLYDLETTGTSSKYDEVIEISAVKVKNGVVTEEFSQLVNPGRPIPSAASAVNHITDDMVAFAPMFDSVLQQFLAFIGDDVLAGHNINRFDMKFLYRDCERYFGQTLTNDYIDTLKLARLCLPELSHHRLGDLAQYYGISTAGAHRALNDCRMNQQVFEKLAKELDDKAVAIMGYRNADTFLDRELSEHATLYVATEDGSLGTKGNVIDCIRENDLKADVLFACGPTPMLRAIKQYAEENKIECYISMEERMACGVGACLGCVCQSKEVDHHSHVHNKRVCKDGPVFLATEVEL